MSKCRKKAVVFDLDDTIGHFEELSLFTSGLKIFTGKSLKESNFYKLLNLFPKFIRPGLLHSLSIIKKAKAKDPCLRVAIYTNNLGPREWTLIIKRYLEHKIGTHLFDRVITGYRSSARTCRTTHHKTYNDLVRCMGLDRDTPILFLDDQRHHKMQNPRVTYLHLHPYNYGVPFVNMVHKFLNSSLGVIIPKRLQPQFVKFMIGYLGSKMGRYRYIVRKTSISKTDIRQKNFITTHLKKFLGVKKKTRRRKYSKNSSRRTRDKK